MDQDSFRKLLETSHARPSSATSRGTIPAVAPKRKKALESSQPVFKPRNVKKEKDQKYRDRAAERRTGDANDYAEVEALLEDFERRTAENEDKAAVEQQRRYLGGDGDHSILVKGLDMALLEQNRARAGLSTEDDDSLEKAFLEVASKPTTQKKRTREDLIRELKEKRQQGEVGSKDKAASTVNEDLGLLEEAKKASKFKPIGAPADDKSKRKRERDKDGQKKKKKRKGDDVGPKAENQADPAEGIKVQADNHQNSVPASPPTQAPQDLLRPPAEPETVDDDFDIFADAGEYQGYDLDDEDDERKDDDKFPETGDVGRAESPDTSPAVGRWFSFEETEKPGQNHASASSKDVQLPFPTAALPEQTGNEEIPQEEEQPSRLVPLESSAMPDIKDFLALEAAEEAMEKRRMRKEKRKGGKGEGEKKKLSNEAKVDRDFKKLQSRTEKKTKE